MKVYALTEGSYSVDSSKKFIPFNPETDNPKDRPASLFIYVQPFLVEIAGKLILLDTGLGYKNEAGKLVIHENIRKAGYDPDDVSMVLMSHLHFDHAAGMVYENDGKWQLSFPHAEYVINRDEWETAYSGESASYHTDIFDIVQRSGSIRFIEGDGALTDQISYEVTGGHCKYHQVFLLNENGDKAFYGADILPEPEQLLRKFKAKYDYDGARSLELRSHYGKLAAEENWLCLFYHAKSGALGRVEEIDGSFKIKKV
ncbi:MBL fold metallo-hydrolase [Arcticibacter eurypsychrophilus]|uniref:MBL fold metallo-hydrolase n=1 Tax=Arcticibacter eurypsychrophilus TaxID=1434752 RepID=UPI00084DDBD9|nr:MBL fold metallo-hydrolase [Arcticibacter eurypsychrophilus]